MNKTLITKLNGRVANTELLRLGELRITIDKEDSPSSKSRSLAITVSKETPIEIVGDGYFTDGNLSANKGKSITLSSGDNTIYVSNDNVVLAILNKYNITKLNFERIDTSISSNAKHKHFDLSSFRYCMSLTSLTLQNTSTTGDISEISNLTSLTNLILSKTLIEGNLSSLSNLTSLTILQLTDTAVTGNLSSLSNLTLLISIQLERTSVAGDLSSLSKMTKLTNIYLRETNTSGNVSDLKGYGLEFLNVTNAVFNADSMKAFKQLRTVILYTSSISGDVATLSDTLSLLMAPNATSKSCTWSSRKSSAKIISMPYYLIKDNIDKMLQDQAQCQAEVTSSYKTITAKGTRTSASDAAIQTLQSKGYTVTILPTD